MQYSLNLSTHTRYFTDLKVISFNLAAESIGIDSESFLFSKLYVPSFIQPI